MGIFDGLLNHEFTISRIARIPDGQGGWVKSWVEIGTVNGRMRPASGAEREVALQEQREISHVLYTRTTADIARGDRVEGGGVSVEVLGVREPSLADHHYEIDCQLVQLEVNTELYS